MNITVLIKCVALLSEFSINQFIYTLFYKGSFIIYEVGGGGIYTKVVANVANHLDKTYVMVHDDECEGKN